MRIVSIRAILFKYFENWKLPLETGTPWGTLLKCRMIASNQHSNVFWTFIFIRSFFMIPLPHIVCLRRNQAGKIVKIMQQAKRQQYFDEFFVEQARGNILVQWDISSFTINPTIYNIIQGPPLTRKSLTRFPLPRFLAYVRVSGGISVSRGPQYSPTNTNFM